MHAAEKQSGYKRFREKSGFNTAAFGASALALSALIAGCSTLKPQPPDPAIAARLTEVRAIAGPPTDSFRYMRMSSYEAIGLADILIFTTPHEAWLLHLDGECRNLDFDSFVDLSSHDHRVSTMLDTVRVRDNPIPCRIEQIWPVDPTVLRHGDREKRVSTQPDAASP